MEVSELQLSHGGVVGGGKDEGQLAEEPGDDLAAEEEDESLHGESIRVPGEGGFAVEMSSSRALMEDLEEGVAGEASFVGGGALGDGEWSLELHVGGLAEVVDHGSDAGVGRREPDEVIVHELDEFREETRFHDGVAQDAPSNRVKVAVSVAGNVSEDDRIGEGGVDGGGHGHGGARSGLDSDGRIESFVWL
jgi:hypothetical protein